MTPSVVRRFAKYHHVEKYVGASPEEAPGDAVSLLAHRLNRPRSAIVEALVRIEDAEIAEDEAQRWDPQGERRLVLLQLADVLYHRAHVDPVEWRKVTE